MNKKSLPSSPFSTLFFPKLFPKLAHSSFLAFVVVTFYPLGVIEPQQSTYQNQGKNVSRDIVSNISDGYNQHMHLYHRDCVMFIHGIISFMQ